MTIIMTSRHRNLRRDLVIRGMGLLAVGVCILAIAFVAHHLAGKPIGAENGWDLSFTALGFVTGSFGSVAAAYGHHLFDRVEVASRWRQLPKGALIAQDDPPAGFRANDELGFADNTIARRYSSTALRSLKMGGRP